MMKRILFLTILVGLIIPLTGYAKGEISGNIFGESGSIYHPFLSLTEIYSTNIYRTEDDTESDLTTVITPGIWISVPKTSEKLLDIETSNNSPGGLNLSRIKPETFRRYQGYFLAATEIRQSLNNADEDQDEGYSDPNIVNFKGDGFFQYNLRGGLSFDFIDQFRNSHEPYGLGVSPDQDQYTSNLFQSLLSYDITEKFSVRMDYSNFQIAYNDQDSFVDYNITDYDRSDNIVSGYIFYKIRPKTAVFSDIEYMDISYNSNKDYDSNEMRYMVGVSWDITEKSNGIFKAGLGVVLGNVLVLFEPLDHVIAVPPDVPYGDLAVLGFLIRQFNVLLPAFLGEIGNLYPDEIAVVGGVEGQVRFQYGLFNLTKVPPVPGLNDREPGLRA